MNELVPTNKEIDSSIEKALITGEIQELFRHNALAVAQRVVDMALNPKDRNSASTLRAAEIILQEAADVGKKQSTLSLPPGYDSIDLIAMRLSKG